jgi:hypothetical protein
MSVTTSVPPQPVFFYLIFTLGGSKSTTRYHQSKKIKIGTEGEGERQREGRGFWGAGARELLMRNIELLIFFSFYNRQPKKQTEVPVCGGQGVASFSPPQIR